MLIRWLSFLIFCLATSGLATEPDARTILERAAEAAGGEDWLYPKTLTLRGTATLYGPNSPAPKDEVADYRMWRVFSVNRTSSHNAEGKVRIDARRADGSYVFQVGYDGDATWTEKGIMPKAAADAYWASAFGFGIVRRALGPEFSLIRVADGNVGGHEIYKVRITDPAGAVTLFGIDQKSYLIRYMAFDSPRGWHERIYDNFTRLSNPAWVQSRHVTLSYDGVVSNVVHWNETQVNAPLDHEIFSPPED